MTDPIFWLGLSILLVAISLTALLTVAIPAFNEMGRAARSAEKLFDTLNRELPPTLEALRITGNEVTDLTDDVTQGVQSAAQVVKQVDQTVTGVKQQAQKAQTTGRSLLAGAKAAWRTLNQSPSQARRSSRMASSRDRRAIPSEQNGNHHIEDVASDLELNYEWEDPDVSQKTNPVEPPRSPVRRDLE
ncbi:MAG: DUF948 domain-containing protein [Leptolyngbya sp. Prado105]|nr:DUF948 domain-containing protein [Leptolyngbya sp. Prado105]